MLTCCTQSGMTALMHCAYRGHCDGLSLLLESGAIVNTQQPKDGVSS